MKNKPLLPFVLLLLLFLSCAQDKTKPIDISVTNNATVYEFKVTNFSNGQVLDDALPAGETAIYTINKGECLRYEKLLAGVPQGSTEGCYDDSQGVSLN